VSLQVWNVILSLNEKYEVTDRIKEAATDALNKAKVNDDKGTISKVDETISSVVTKFDDLNKEYDLGTQASKVLSTTATFSNKAIDKAIELNKEYEITNKVGSSISEAASKAADKAKQAKE
jgi:GTP cyclohydrolase III